MTVPGYPHSHSQPMAGNSGPLRFLVTADSFLPHSGGSRVYYANLYKNLLAMYPDTMTVLTRKVPGWKEFDRHETGANFRIQRFLKPLPNWKYWQLPKAIPQLAGEAAHVLAGSYDCLHCGDLFPQGLNGVALRRLFRLPMLMFCHGDEVSQTDRRRYQPRVRNFIYRHADVIIAANQFAYDGLVRIGIPEDRLHKLTPGVNFEQFYPAPPRRDLIERYGLQGAKVLLTVARMVPRKGHKIVLEALPQVIREVPNLKYLIAGDGPEGPQLQQQARQLGIQDAVIFAGDIPHGEVCDFYNLCNVFIMANRLEAGGDVESFGMVFTEANAVGKPVIGGRSGGTAEAVLDGKTGFLADPGNADEIARRLLQLLKNEDLAASMGAAGMARVRAEFNWSSRAQAVRQISAEMVMRARREVQSPAAGVRPEDSGVSA
ncbi:MAG TPA: glycosyltransferase family 4 protein [Candidatus Saccharimonadales bacterium]|jgi:phosphatidylinositol alpha-1,6-mannosyltransferase|nr:glycosyltransferase family 4 protein [Candidatus Saccharimonadales bacterium]